MTVQHLRIGLDLDGVVCDFHGALIEAVGAPSRMDGWDWATWYPLSLEKQAQAAAFTADPESYANLAMLPGAKRGVRALHDFGHKITIVTARPKDAEEATQAWVRRHLRGDIEEVMVVGGNGEKVERIVEQAFHLVIDDNAVTIQRLVELGIGAVVFNQPWNVGKVDAPRVYDWRHLRYVINGR